MTCAVASKLSSFSDGGSVPSLALEECKCPAVQQQQQQQQQLKACSARRSNNCVQVAAGGGSEERRKSFSGGSSAPALAWGAAQKLPELLCSRRSCTAHAHGRPARLPEAWWEGQLAEGIHRTLQMREKRLETIKLASPQLHRRQVKSAVDTAPTIYYVLVLQAKYD